MRRKTKNTHLQFLVFLLTITSFLTVVLCTFYSLSGLYEELSVILEIKNNKVRTVNINRMADQFVEGATDEGPEININRITRHYVKQISFKAEIEAMVKGWEVNVSRNTRHYILPENVTTIINLRNVSTQLFMMVMVSSAPAHFDRRSAIRDTWASLTDNSTRVAFLLGTTDNSTLQSMILEESELYDDIIQERFVDSYNNLTIKSVMMLKWMLNNLSARFLMKTDDDTYINLPALSEMLRQVRMRENMLLGYLICKSKPVHNPTDKWYTPRYIYNKTHYPPFLSGSGYVMSEDVISKLYRAALNTPIVHMEDVYITGICALAAHMQPRGAYGFFAFRRSLIPLCNPLFFTYHELFPEDQRTIFSHINNCSTPFLKFISKIQLNFVSGVKANTVHCLEYIL